MRKEREGEREGERGREREGERGDIGIWKERGKRGGDQMLWRAVGMVA